MRVGILETFLRLLFFWGIYFKSALIIVKNEYVCIRDVLTVFSARGNSSVFYKFESYENLFCFEVKEKITDIKIIKVLF